MFKELLVIAALTVCTSAYAQSPASSQLDLTYAKPILQVEKDLYFHPDEFMATVGKRFKELGYDKVNVSFPTREQTLLQLTCLEQKLEEDHPDPSTITDTDFVKTWKKDSTVIFLSSLYYWLNGPKHPTADDGMDDAWNMVSSNMTGFERSVNHLTKK